jgi:hypothetical protein
MMRIGGTIETPKTHISSFWMLKKGDHPLPPPIIEGLGSPWNREDSVAPRDRKCIIRFVLTMVGGNVFCALVKGCITAVSRELSLVSVYHTVWYFGGLPALKSGELESEGLIHYLNIFIR